MIAEKIQYKGSVMDNMKNTEGESDKITLKIELNSQIYEEFRKTCAIERIDEIAQIHCLIAKFILDNNSN